MASLFKKSVVRYVDQDGKRVAKDSPGAGKTTERSTKWYGKYRDGNGIVRVVPLYTDKAASRSRLAELVRRSDRKESGLADPLEEHARRPLSDHVEDYQRCLVVKENTADHVELTMARIQAIVKGCSFQRLADLSAQRVVEWLADARRCGMWRERWSSYRRFRRVWLHLWLHQLVSFWVGGWQRTAQKRG